MTLSNMFTLTLTTEKRIPNPYRFREGLAPPHTHTPPPDPPGPRGSGPGRTFGTPRHDPPGGGRSPGAISLQRLGSKGVPGVHPAGGATRGAGGLPGQFRCNARGPRGWSKGSTRRGPPGGLEALSGQFRCSAPVQMESRTISLQCPGSKKGSRGSKGVPGGRSPPGNCRGLGSLFSFVTPVATPTSSWSACSQSSPKRD